MTLDVVGWRLEDPQQPSHAEFQFPYAEWLHVLPYQKAFGAAPVALEAPSAKAEVTTMPGIAASFGLGDPRGAARCPSMHPLSRQARWRLVPVL